MTYCLSVNLWPSVAVRTLPPRLMVAIRPSIPAAARASMPRLWWNAIWCMVTIAKVPPFSMKATRIIQKLLVRTASCGVKS